MDEELFSHNCIFIVDIEIALKVMVFCFHDFHVVIIHWGMSQCQG